MAEKTTGTLTGILKSTHPETVGQYLKDNAEVLLDGDFAGYLSAIIHKKHLKKGEVFLAANIGEGYGYKLLSGEKRPPHRDTVLRLCIAAGLTLEETQQALHLASMAVLYPKIGRDAVLISCIASGVADVYRVDESLIANGFEPLRPCVKD